jgi:hypothetical protein
MTCQTHLSLPCFVKKLNIETGEWGRVVQGQARITLGMDMTIATFLFVPYQATHATIMRGSTGLSMSQGLTHKNFQKTGLLLEISDCDSHSVTLEKRTQFGPLFRGNP